jgi:hypothetical protein
MNRTPEPQTPQTQFTTDRTWQKVPTKLLTNATTGQAEVYVKSGFPFPDVKIAEVGANNQWAFTENGKSELLKRYNNLNNTNITEQEITKLFFIDGTKTFNNDRASIINKHSNSETKLNLSTKENPVPGVVNPQTGAKSGQTAQTEAKPGDPEQPNPLSGLDEQIKETVSSLDPEQTQNRLNWAENPVIPGSDAYLRKDFSLFKYPISIDGNGQDYLKFDIIEYGIRPTNKGGIGLKPRTPGSTKGTICLPIQPSISDNNRVNWNEDSIDIVDLALQTTGMGLMGAEDVSSQIKKVLDTAKSKVSDPKMKDAFGAIAMTALAQKATQSQNNLLSRMSGAVLNPNMELLFQGPILRPFQFSFRMTPRDVEEAKQVRSIIRAFKEASAVQQGIENLFMKAPHVFRIRYILGSSKNQDDHPSINRIKICALQQMSVDYTPDQTFMTYNDKNATMTSYAMSLTFTELEPIYAHDYADNENNPIPIDHIGY